MNPSASSRPPRERRAEDRRTSTDRRGSQRRLVVDRRYSTERRGSSGTWLAAEPPAEHVRNAMQLLAAALDSQTPVSSDEFARHAEAALARLSLALAGLEENRR